jgi:hypothetical protein
MPTNFLFSLATYTLLATAAFGSSTAAAQVPTRSTQPVLAPARDPQTLTPGQPTVGAPEAVAPAAQPAAAPAPAPAVAPAPTGVTAVPAAAPTTSSTSQAATGRDSRAYTAGKFGLVLAGNPLTWLRSADGGTARADVVIESPGPDQIPGKHIAGVKYENISLSTDFQSKAITDWISTSWKTGAARQSGSIVAATYDYNIVSEREFTNALLVETTLPALDAGSKDAALITVKLAPEYTRLKQASGKASTFADNKAAKQWLASNFRFEMTGLDASKVSKIDSFTVRQVSRENPVGEMRDYEKVPGSIEFPNLRITFAASTAASWENWHEDFVVKGNNGADKERNGAIVYLDPTRTAELGRVNLSNCGIFRLSAEKVEAGSEQLRRLVADLYCERMEMAITGK